MKGSRIKLLREEKNLKQDELAKILSISPSAIGMYERDEREPNDELTLKIAEYFNVTTDYLLGKTDARNIDEIIKEYKPPYYKEAKGLSDQEIQDALIFYKEMKNKIKGN